LTSPKASKGPGWRKVEEETGEKAPVERSSKDVCAWDIKIDLEQFWKQVKRIRKSDHSPTIQFCTTKFGYELIKSNPDEFRYDLVWDKQRGVSFLSANKMPMRSHEMIYVFSKAGAFYERKDIVGDFKSWKVKREGQTTHCYGGTKKTDTEGGDGKRCALSIIQMDGHLSRHKGQHPTEKPSDLYKFLIERYCPAGGTVLDPTFGSGNSVFTAFALGRNAIGIEKDEKFFEKAEARLNALP
jgi:site-specific DNA-methyltransferase (adenine-specific)